MKSVKKIMPQISVQRITLISMLLALIIVLKYAFGFVPGIEFVTFMFVFLGIFLSVADVLLLVSSFNFFVLIIYGFGNWWFAYWIIWPFDALFSKLISKRTKNKFVFATFGFFAGFSVFFWYFFSDFLFFGRAYAITNLITALPINLIEGATTAIACLVIAPPLSKVFNHYSNKRYYKINSWTFKKIKNLKLNMFLTILTSIVLFVGVILLFVFNGFFIDWQMSSMVNRGDAGMLQP